MRIEREREDGAIRYRWVIGPCGDPYCRQKVHAYCLVDIANRERWFMSAVLDVDELDGADVVEDTIAGDRDLCLARRSTVIKAYVNAQNNPTHDPIGCGCALDMLNHFSALTGRDPLAGSQAMEAGKAMENQA